MDLYHLWFDLKDTHRDVEFARNLDAYLGRLKQEGVIHGFRLTRRKLGFGPPELQEFHVVIEVKDLAQLEASFQLIARREGEIEKLHRAVYGMIAGLKTALYRDFPDPVRAR